MVTLWLDSWPFRVKPRSFSLPFSPHFFLSFLPPIALIEVLFVYHKIQLFHMRNSMTFKWIFSVVQLFPQPNIKHCRHPKKDMACPCAVTFHSHSQPKANINLFFVSIDLTSLTFSYKWNYVNVLLIVSRFSH